MLEIFDPLEVNRTGMTTLLLGSAGILLLIDRCGLPEGAAITDLAQRFTCAVEAIKPNSKIDMMIKTLIFVRFRCIVSPFCG